VRVTVVATGLSRQGAQRRTAPPLQVLRTGTDNLPVGLVSPEAPAAAQTPSSLGGSGIPAVWRTGRTHAAARVDGMSSAGMDDIEIPAFLRKQAD